MIIKIVKSLVVAVTIVIFISAAGCNQKSYQKMQYILEAKRAYPPEEKRIADSLFVNRFTINPEFDSKQFVYQISNFEYEADYYNEFYIPPAIMITQKVSNWLSESGLFQRVSESIGYSSTPDYILEGNIVSLYCDFRDPTLPMAVMEIRFFLSKNKSMEDPVLVFSKDYKFSFTFENGEYVNLIKAYDSCLTEILTKMEKDLSGI